MTVASIHGVDPVKTAAGIKIIPDIALVDVKDKEYDVILLPGGMGAFKVAECQIVGEMLKKQDQQGRLIGAICYGPMALLANQIGFGKSITSYPVVRDKLHQDYKYSEDDVVQDGNLITSRGPATVYRYALKIAENLVGLEKTKARAELNLFMDFY